MEPKCLNVARHVWMDSEIAAFMLQATHDGSQDSALESNMIEFATLKFGRKSMGP